MKYPTLTAALFFLFSHFSYSQRNYGEFNRNTIIHGKNGETKTNSYLSYNPDYDLAIRHFLDLLEKDSTNLEYIVDLAFTYFKSPYQKTMCIPYCEKAIKMGKPEEVAELYYPLGISYRMMGEYEKAIAALQAYTENLKSYDKFLPQNEIIELVAEVNREIGICRNAIAFEESLPIKFNFDNKLYTYFINSAGKKINSIYDDYNPIILHDTVMIFTSRRSGSLEESFHEDGRYFEDIYSAVYIEKNWSEAKRMNISTRADESANSISKDKSKLYIVRNSGKPRIMASSFTENKWGMPQKIKSEKNSKAWERCMNIAMYDTVVYFVKNSKDGFGGKDIYKSVKSADGSWSAAINLGPVINTPFQEESPFLSPDGKHLYFASNGHNTMGGYDIFRSKFINNSWTTPENLLPPINSQNNELYFTIIKEANTAYLSSQRIRAGRNDMNIYQISFKPEFESAKFAMLEQDKCSCRLDTFRDPRYIYDFEAGTIIMNGVEVQYFFEDGKILTGDKMDADGRFPLRELSYDNPYSIRLKTQDASPEKEKILCERGQIIVRGPGGAMYTMVADAECVFRIKNIKSKFVFTTLEKENIKDLTLKLLDEDDLLICETQTDENGEFCYINSPHHRLRKIKLVTDNPPGFKEAEIIVMNAGKKFYRFRPDENAVFWPEGFVKDTSVYVHAYRFLQPDTNYANISGIVYDDNSFNRPAKNIGVLLKDEKKELYKRTVTDSLGAFFFEKIPADHHYSISLDETSPDFNPGIKYLILGNVEFYGQKIPAEKFKLYLDGNYNENLIKMVTDKKGRFQINYLPADHSTVVTKLEEKDSAIIHEVQSEPTADTLLIILFGYDKSSIENIYLDKLEELCTKCLKDTSSYIQITGHTDSNGSDEYNLKLSKRRAEAIAAYIASKKIKRKRINIQAAGESQPASPNRFPDGTDNPEGRKQNRRVEILIRR